MTWYRTIAGQALERWRDARGRLDVSPSDSPEMETAVFDEGLAEADYDQAVDAARREYLPEPPPFSEAVETIDASPD